MGNPGLVAYYFVFEWLEENIRLNNRQNLTLLDAKAKTENEHTTK